MEFSAARSAVRVSMDLEFRVNRAGWKGRVVEGPQGMVSRGQTPYSYAMSLDIPVEATGQSVSGSAMQTVAAVAGGGSVAGGAAVAAVAGAESAKVDISSLLTLRETVQGVTVDVAAADDVSKADVLEKMFDFRGDVTLTLTDGRDVTGYVFDRTKVSDKANGGDVKTAAVRLLPAGSDARMTISYGQISKVTFGRDTALGKSFETWIKKYVEKRMKGERANIESEVL